MTQCPICCESYTAQTRANILCNNLECGYSACKQCIRQYLLTTASDPHCMKCKKGWDYRFVVEQLNKNWYDKDYRTHRKKLLLERQLAMLPDTMEAASRKRETRSHTEKIAKLAEDQRQLRKQIKQIEIEKNSLRREIDKIKGGQGEKKKFIMACPAENCRGFLSTNYKCGVCEQYSCSKCVEFIGDHGEIQFHQCDPDQVKTANLIREQTKPCPGCGERISKVEGCDQMWCTICKVAFSWRTGQRDTGQIHNPHFFEARRQLGLGVRNPGDQVCGGMPYWWTIEVGFNKLLVKYETILIEKYSTRDNTFKDMIETLRKQFPGGPRHNIRTSPIFRLVLNIYRRLVEFERVYLVPTRTQLQTYTDTTELRIQYILNEITKEKLATTLLRNDKLRKKYNDLLHIYETIMAVGIDTFRHLEQISQIFEEGNATEKHLDEIVEKFKILEEIRKYSNAELQKISQLYSHQVIQLKAMWITERKKFSSKSLQKKKLQEAEANGQGAFAQ